VPSASANVAVTEALGSCHVRRIQAGPRAVRHARVFVHQVLADRGEMPNAEDLELMLSALATNAVRHARLAFHVVIEQSPPEPTPAGRRADGVQPVVPVACERWGIHMVRDHRCVWCGRELLTSSSGSM
jgi:hypothetical protein